MKNEFAIYSVSFYVLFIFLFGVFIDLCVDVAVDIYFVSRIRMGFRVEKKLQHGERDSETSLILSQRA